MNPQVTLQSQKPQHPGINLASWRLSKHPSGASEFIRRLLQSETTLVFGLFVLHIILALVMKLSPELALAHAAITFFAGLWYAGSGVKLYRIAIWGAYVTGAEVLWRMTKTPIPWEFCKYAICTIFLVAIVRTGQFKGRVLILFYFACLLPSLILPMTNVPLNIFFDQVSFNLSGPLAMALSLWFFSRLQLTALQTNRVFCALTCPVLGIGILALRGIVTAKDLVFDTESNFATSGGFGPNQVSAMLGLGALAAIVWVQSKEITLSLRLLLLLLALYFTGQAAMTFSRSGVYLLAGGLSLSIPFIFRNRRLRLQMLVGLVLGFVAIIFLLMPKLDAFTQGALTQRFSETQDSQRGQIMREDWRLFNEHLLFGVGPGQAKFHVRGIYSQFGAAQVASHNEFARLLAEHGIWGAFALLSLLFMGLQHFLKAATPNGRLVTLTMTFWSFAFLFISAMRIVAPAFIFGLTAARFLDSPLPAAVPAPKQQA